MEWKIPQEKLPKEGKGCLIRLEDKEIALFCCKGSYYAISDTCTHEGGPLSEGELEGSVVTCPWHGWQFDVETGKCQNLIGEDVESFKVEKRADGYYLIASS